MDKKFLDSMYARSLKPFSIRQIEEQISKALTELSAAEYETTISSIDFDPTPNAFLSDTVEIKLTVQRRKKSTLSDDK